MKKNLLLVCLLGLVLCGCGQKKEKVSIMEKKEFVMGLDDTFAPMGFKNDKGEIVGFDIDLAKEVAKRLDMKVSFQNIDWDLKETELENGSIDCIWNGYSITDKRKEKVLFSDSYLDNKQIIITLDKNQVETKEDLKDKVVSVQKNSSAYDAVSKDKAFVASLKNKELIQFDTNNDCFMDLEAGRSDAIVVDETLARYYMKQQDQDIYKVLDEDFGKEEYAIGFRKTDTAFQQAVNKTLQDMKNDGTFDKIKGQWFQD